MDGGSRYERIIHERLFGFGDAYYIKDKFSGYKYRYGFGPGIGYDFVNTAINPSRVCFLLSIRMTAIQQGLKNRITIVQGRLASSMSGI